MPKRERFKLSVSVFLFLVKNGEVLLLQRGNTGWMDGMWSVPAGAIDGGETLMDAVIREAKEEVDVIVTPESVRLVHTMHCFTGEDEWLGQYFLAEQWDGEPILNEPEKHSGLQWCSVDSLPGTVIPYVKQAMENYRAGIAYSEYSNINE